MKIRNYRIQIETPVIQVREINEVERGWGIGRCRTNWNWTQSWSGSSNWMSWKIICIVSLCSKNVWFQNESLYVFLFLDRCRNESGLSIYLLPPVNEPLTHFKARNRPANSTSRRNGLQSSTRPLLPVGRPAKGRWASQEASWRIKGSEDLGPQERIRTWTQLIIRTRTNRVLSPIRFWTLQQSEY